jgi:hypothetical protein
MLIVSIALIILAAVVRPSRTKPVRLFVKDIYLLVITSGFYRLNSATALE